jgi:hypothetical protein
VITPEDRLYHELKKIKRQLEALLQEYEAGREQPGLTPPPIPKFKLILNQMRNS